MLEIFEENGNSGAYSECGCGCGCSCSCSCILDLLIPVPVEGVTETYFETLLTRGDFSSMMEDNYRTAG